MMEWKFIKWEDLGELKCLIRFHIDKGCHRSLICDAIERDNPDKWTRNEIHIAMTELKKARLIAHMGHAFYKVTEWGNDDVVKKAATNKNYTKALRILRDCGVYHRDMDSYGILNGTEEEQRQRRVRESEEKLAREKEIREQVIKEIREQEEAELAKNPDFFKECDEFPIGGVDELLKRISRMKIDSY